jgi:Xaa-Pro dipeptidase
LTGQNKAQPADEVPKEVTAAFFPHGIGHSLGLQTHDVGCRRQPPRADNPFLRNTRTIAAGQVFTVEPGVYFIAQLLQPLRQSPLHHWVHWPSVDLLLPFGGARIEDNVVVTSDGHWNLTRAVLP